MGAKRRGNPPKRKGTRIENEIVDRHVAAGLKARRIVGSGMFAPSFGKELADDLRVLNEELHAEVKARKNGEGFKTLENWIPDGGIVFLRRNHAKPLVAMEWDTYVKLAKSVQPEVVATAVTTGSDTVAAPQG